MRREFHVRFCEGGGVQSPPLLDTKGQVIPPAPVESLTFRKFAEKFKKREVADRPSAETTAYRLPILIAFFGDRPLKDVTASAAEDFLDTLRQPTRFHPKHKADRVRQPSTINRWRALLVRMFSWAVEKDYLERNPFTKPGIRKSLLPRGPENDPRTRRLQGDEAQRLATAAGQRLRLLINFACLTGMRKGEMLSLTWADVDLERGWIHLKGRNTKSGKPRSLAINPQLKAILRFLRTDANGDGKPATCAVLSNECGEPIRSFDTAWKIARTKAGLKDLRWHDLRREFGSRFLEAGGHLIQAQQLLGHADPGMTRRYLNLGDETLKAVQNLMTAPMDLGIPESAEVSPSLHNPAGVEPDTRPVPPRIC